LRIYDRYPANQQLLDYNARGELIGILDKSVDSDRYLEIGYYRLTGDAQGDFDLETDSGFVLGRIAQFRDYTGRLTTFEYSLGGVLEKRLGPQTASGEGGFTGRPVTVYLNQSPLFGQLQGITAGNGAGQTGGGNGGNALFVATPAGGGNSDEKPVMTGGTGAGGPVSINAGANNSAAGAESIDHGSSTADNSATSFAFDAFGFPRLIKMVGNLLGEVEYGPTFGTNGLLAKMVYPEGNSVEYTYDSANPVFRARANLLSIKKLAGPRGGDPATMTSSYDSYDLRYNVPGSHTDFNQNTHSMSLRSDGRDVEVINHSGAGQTRTIRNEYGQIEEESDPSGIRKEYDYRDEDGFLDKSRRGTLETGYAYNNTVAGRLGMPTTITPPLNASIQLAYDARLLQTTMTRGGYQEASGYDENGNLVRLTRTLGGGKVYRENRFYNQINFLDRIEIDHQGETLSTVYTPDAVFRVEKETLPGGETRDYTYDHQGNVRTMKVGGYEEAYERDKHGNLTELKIGGELVREFEIDGFDRVTVETRKGESDETVTRTYWPNGELKSMKVESAAGVVQDMTVSVVDAVGRARVMAMTGSAVSGSQTIDYASAGSGGLVVTTIGPRDTVTETYDAAGRIDKRVSTTIGEVDFTQDDNDSLTGIKSTEDGVAYTVTRIFNSLDHLESQSDDVGQLFSQSPRLDGLPTTVTDARNQISSHDYSELGRLLKLTRPESVEFRYRFDKNLQPAFVGDKTEQGHTMSYTDGTLRLTSTALRNGESFGYGSPDGRNFPQAITIPGGNITRTYDLLGRVQSESVTYSGGNYAMSDATYDALNRLRSADYGAGSADNSLEFEYDPLGSLVRATYDEGGESYDIGYGLYPDGTVARIDYPSGPSLTIGRDNAGRLLSVAGSGPVLTISSYKGVGVPAVIQHGGVIQEENTYDLRKRLKSRRYTRSSDGAVLADLRFQYDAGDNLLARQHLHRAGRADVFEYDNASRLKAAGYGARPDFEGAVGQNVSGFPTSGAGLLPGLFARTYAYDGGGLDLLQSSALANPGGLPVAGSGAPVAAGFAIPPFAGTISGHDGYLFPTTVDGQTRSRDDLGNAAAGTILFVRPAGAADPVRQVAADIRHNGRANLVAVERPDGTEIRYHYQPSGLMHRREVESGGSVIADTALVWEAGRLIEEYDLLEGELRARYYYDDGDAPTAAEIRAAGGNLQWYYFLRDADFSVIGLADGTGTVVERVSYDAWGQPLIEAQDIAAPRVARVVQGTDGALLVEFTEAIFPPVSLASGNDLVTTAGSIDSVVGIDGVEAEVEWLEAVPGFPYGTVLQVTPSQSLGSYILQIAGGTLIDTWNNGNEEETVTVTGGAAEGTVLYVASGNPTLSTAPLLVARSAVGNPFLFHGQWFDYETGLSYMRARWYDPNTGSFTERDPIDYAESVNSFAGFANNPTSRRDPWGSTSVIGKGAAMALEEFLQKGSKTVGKVADEINQEALDLVAKQALEEADKTRVVHRDFFRMMDRAPGRIKELDDAVSRDVVRVEATPRSALGGNDGLGPAWEGVAKVADDLQGARRLEVKYHELGHVVDNLAKTLDEWRAYYQKGGILKEEFKSFQDGAMAILHHGETGGGHTPEFVRMIQQYGNPGGMAYVLSYYADTMKISHRQAREVMHVLGLRGRIPAADLNPLFKRLDEAFAALNKSKP